MLAAGPVNLNKDKNDNGAKHYKFYFCRAVFDYDR